MNLQITFINRQSKGLDFLIYDLHFAHDYLGITVFSHLAASIYYLTKLSIRRARKGWSSIGCLDEKGEPGGIVGASWEKKIRGVDGI